MRCQKSIIHVFRNTPQLPSRFNIPRRHASSPRNFEPYVLPRHVIDLDAADSEYVLRAKDTPVHHIPALTYRERLNDETGTWGNKKTRRIGKPPINVAKANPADLWSYVLLGCDQALYEFPLTATASRLLYSRTRIRRIAKRIGMDPLGSVEVAMAHFVDGFSTDATKNLEIAGFVRTKHADIRLYLGKTRAWWTTRALVSLLSSTREGCEFLAGIGDTLLIAIVNCRKTQYSSGSRAVLSPSMILSLLDNFRINASSKNVEMGAHLCNGALYYASKYAHLPAIKMYLQMAQFCNYAPQDWRARSALSELVSALLRDRRGLSTETERRTALELITGWEGGREPREGQPRRPCFAYLAFKNVSQSFAWAIYPKYLVGLGDLRMTEAIYAEWMSPEPKRMDAVLRGHEHLRFRSHMFAVAFLIADDPKRALQVLESVPIDHRDTSDIEPHVYSHWKYFCSINTEDDARTLKKGSAWLKAIILDHYKFHRFAPTPQLRVALQNFVLDMPDEPQQALKILQKVVITREITRHRSSCTHKPLRHLDWVKEDGEERVQLI
ncbi:hypothetical protein PZA11_007123 [Diplocarpon coronariae]|nr:hypothetical protein JHW43_001600 [Diplocarpon mali]